MTEHIQLGEAVVPAREPSGRYRPSSRRNSILGRGDPLLREGKRIPPGGSVQALERLAAAGAGNAALQRLSQTRFSRSQVRPRLPGREAAGHMPAGSTEVRKDSASGAHTERTPSAHSDATLQTPTCSRPEACPAPPAMVPSLIADVLASAGRPLDRATRSRMEDGFAMPSGHSSTTRWSSRLLHLPPTPQRRPPECSVRSRTLHHHCHRAIERMQPARTGPGERK